MLAEAVRDVPPRPLPPRADPTITRLSGLEPLVLPAEGFFAIVGERTNVTGSPRFAAMIREGDLEGGLAVARQQVEAGANLIDVNFDEALLDGPAVMTRFLHLVASDPAISRVPVMIDSSRFETLEAGLRCVQGKAVVNSISLKEGEAAFLAQARRIRRYGAAVVVMAFDEQGQASDRERKVAIARRAVRLLVDEVGFDPADVIVDPNVLTVATGIPEHDRYAVEFFEAVREIKASLPGVRTSGGVSNVSFSFRGNAAVREAMHAAFLFHARRAGLDMAIVNAGQLAVYEDVPKDLLERVEDVLLARRDDATRPPDRVRDRGARARRRDGREGRRVAAPAGRGTAGARARPRSRRLRGSRRRGGPSRGGPTARRDRGAADGGHARRRRSVRRRQDVPAAGRPERARDEARGRLADSASRGRAPRRRGDASAPHPDGDRQGRRPRHRQEHRGRRARVQRVRGPRSRRDGARRDHPRPGRRPSGPT